MAEKLRVLIAAAEAAPFAKAGGLADVVGALPAALAKLDVDARVIVPRYGDLREAERIRWKADLGRIPLEIYTFGADLWEAELPGSSVPIYFVGNSDFFSRPGIYDDPVSGEGYWDNFQRFVFFMKAVFVACRRIGWLPHVIHCNDSHTALIPAYLKLVFRADKDLARVGSLYTIHNLAYQGRVGMDLFKLTDLPRDLTYPNGPFEYFGDLNMMKAGILFADVINTVSPTYAREIQYSPEYGHGLETVLHSRRGDLHGILNGVDDQQWNPATDEFIPARYSAGRLAGKAKDKSELQQACGFPVDSAIPLIGIISRLVDQKGLDLVLEALPQITDMNVQMVLLGSGQKKYHQAFQDAARRFPQRLSANFGFDDKLAHWIEAGSDMFLMPSRYEPCGLNQMYSLRYGTVPIVRHTGGLADTVKDYHQDPQGNGFKFFSYSSREMLEAMRRAMFAFQDKTGWRALMRRGMAEDFSWKKSAVRYKELYQLVIGKMR
ncbi:MAG TPA: glycogen synthase GlgA [Acidobacteriota bacterium]|jgi:starch synthase